MKVLHTADFHFRGKDFDEINKCVSYILEGIPTHKPDLIIIAGDLTDSRALQLESKAARAVFHVVSTMMNYAPVAIITGTPSHDGNVALALRALKGKYPLLVSATAEQAGYQGNYSPNGGGGSWLDTNYMHEQGITPDFILTQIPTPTKQHFITDLGIEDSDHAIATAMETMFLGFKQRADLFHKTPHVMSGHLTVGGAFISDTQQIIGMDIEVSKGQIETLGADLVCLGHIHKRQIIGNNIFYCGSPTRLNFGEKDDKGFYFHYLQEGKDTLTEFIKTPARELVELKADFTKLNFDTNRFEMDICDVTNNVTDGSIIKLTITEWQDKAEAISDMAYEELFYNAGYADVKFSIIRKPRETVRSEEVMEVETLPEKIVAMSKLRGEHIDGKILIKANALEINEKKPWVELCDGIINKEVENEKQN